MRACGLRPNREESLGLLLCVAFTLVGYFPVFMPTFPLEQESAYYFGQLQGLPWYRIPFYAMNYGSLPVTNLLIRIAMALCAIHKNLYFAAVISAHIVNTFILMRLARRLFKWVYGATAYAWAPVSVGILFCGCNAYYHVLITPLSSCYVIFTAFLILLVTQISAKILLEPPAGKRPVLAMALAFLAPLCFFTSISFFLILLSLLWLLRDSKTASPRKLAPIVAANLVSVLFEVLFVDARFSPFSYISLHSHFNPSNSGFLPTLLANPALYFTTVVQTALQGLFFGLFYQNFLFFNSVSDVDYWLGGILFTLSCIGIAFAQPKERRLLVFSCLGMFAYLFNATLVRNPLTTEVQRYFDGYFVASMPRYYYLPSAFFSLFLVGTFEVLRRKTAPQWRWCVHTMAVVGMGTFATLNKTLYASYHMASEIYRYTPAIVLRAPRTDPARPSFLFQ